MQAAPNKADMLTSGGEAGRAEMQVRVVHELTSLVHDAV